MAIALYDGGIIREAVVIRLTISSLQQLDIEGLWRLHQLILIAWYGDGPHRGTGTL